MEYDTKLILGQKNSYGGDQPFGLWPADRRQHLYIIGQTGAGKTTLLKNLIIQDLDAGGGVGVIDPHGDLASDLLDHIPPRRTHHLVYFNPADLERPIGFNLLAHVPPEARPLVASSVVSVLKSIWRDSWGPRLEYILYNCVAALLDCQSVSLLGLQRMLIDATYREWIVRQVKDPLVRSFWEHEFANYERRFLQEAIAPIQNKVGQLLAAPAVRNILCQVRSRFDPRFMMDHERILIANLAKGSLGEDKSNLLGAVLVSKFQLSAMSRTNIPEAERRDFHLYIDEFQNFSSDAFASILSEARKYRLCLILSHQYLDQLRDDIRKAVLGNAGTIVAFRISPRDAELLETDLATSSRHLATQGNGQITVKLLEAGQYGETIIGRTFAPPYESYGRKDALITLSREKFGTPREQIEDKLERWFAARDAGEDE